MFAMLRLFVQVFVCFIIFHFNDVANAKLCSEPATDVIFLVDNSGSLKENEFQTELDFAAKMIMQFNLGPQNYQAGFYTFSTDAQSHIQLGKFTENAALASSIKQIPYVGGFTFLGKSLKTVNQGFSLSAGGRNNVRKALIIISDGNTVDVKVTAESVKLLRDNDVQVYAIVFGSKVDMQLSRSLVAKSSDLFKISKISDLDSVLDGVKKTVCIDEIPVCGVRQMDIVFVLDESFSVELDQFTLLRYFVSRFVRNSKIGPKYAQISIVAFADKVRNVFWLNDYKYKDDVSAQIHQLQRIGGVTYTNLALKHVRMESFKKEHGGRSGAQKVVVVLTDGQSLMPEETLKEARGLHNIGANVFAVGVGHDVSLEELKKVASTEDYVFHVTTFDMLAEIEQEFRMKVCKTT
ncbi:COL6A [Acanthosepion pharaonis]|uniref:COL6A n=1 Tax=Acanthosepion pharaonis TaxID=158019 RepID=A0A812B674_ACAPH|nr:COL6A [Sepia pharaonis]